LVSQERHLDSITAGKKKKKKKKPQAKKRWKGASGKSGRKKSRREWGRSAHWDRRKKKRKDKINQEYRTVLLAEPVREGTSRGQKNFAGRKTKSETVPKAGGSRGW